MEVTDGAGYAIQWQSGTSYIAPSGNYNGGSITYPTILALVFPNSSYACGFYGNSLGVKVLIELKKMALHHLEDML